MAYKRYAKKNGKIYGPYYYESYREDGKVKKIYIGQKLPPSSVVPRSKLFSFVVIFIALAVLISLAFFIKPTGKVSLQTEPNYELDEFLSGQATITLQEGDSIQKDTQVTLALLKEDTILAETTKTLEEFFGGQINYTSIANDSISCVNITVPYEQEVCENVTNPETIEEVCHDEQLENETIQVCENVTTPEETILVCTNQTLENSEENCTTTTLTDYYYQTAGSYSVDLHDILDYTLTEPGDYILRFSIPSMNIESLSSFSVSAPEEPLPPVENETNKTETKEQIPMHAENLVNNDGFETWTNGAGPFTLVGNTTADYWILMQEGMGGCGPTVTRTSTAGQYRSGSYGLKWDVTACWNYNMWGAGGVYYNITNYQNFANKTINFSIWMNTSEPQGHAPGRVFIDDGVIRTYSANNHTGDGTWQLLSVQATVSSSPTKLWAGAVLHGRQPNQAGTSAIFYVDDATMSMRANVSSCGNLSVAGGVYVLTQNITIPGGNCFIINANNVTLDCQGYTINGTYSSGFGIYNVGFKNVTVKNCRIIQFWYGIYFVTNANEGTIINNTVNLNQLGIVFGTANNNTITNNVVNYNTNYGIFLNIASGNNYTNNNASGNTIGDFLSQGNSLNNLVVNLTTQQNLISFISKDIMLKGLTTAGVPTDLSGYRNISKYLSITNNTATSWIYLNISYNDSNVPAGIPESSLKLWKNNASGWFLAGAGINSVDTANNIVYANITQFGSTFAPLGQVPDYSPNVTLVSPNNGVNVSANSITFIANVSDDIGFVNASIWHNVSGIFALNSTLYPGVITPDSTTKGLWHFDEGDNKTAEDSALTNDGTHYGNTKLLLRFDENTDTTTYDASIYGSNGTLDYSRTLVENCNSTAGWTVGPSGNSISLNTTVFKEGSNAINLIKGATDTTSFYAYKNIPSTNMSNRYINLWIYVKDSTALGKINYPFVYVMDQYPPVNWWIRKDFSQSFLSVGWNLLSFNTSSPSASFGTPNLSAAGATGMGFFTTASSYTTSTGDVIMDYFFLTSTTPAGPTWAAGKSNTGLSFDGVNDYVSIADAASLKFGSSDFALEAWVKTSSSANQIIIDKQKETANFNFYGIRIYNSKIWAAASDCGTGGCGFGTTRWPLVGNKTLTDGVWHHVAFTREGASLKIYVDGTLDNSTSQGPWDTDSISQFMIGAYNPSNPQQFFNGTIDEFAAYNKSLSASEVLAHYNAGKAKFTDWTSNGRFGNAIEFDGIDDYVEVQDSASLRSPTTQITLAAWIKTGGKATAQEIIEKDYGPANATGWQSYDISLSSENKFAFAVSEGSVFEGGGDYIYWISTQSLANNTWYFVAGTWNYSAGDKTLNGKIYINGQNVSYTNLNTSGVVTAIGHNGTGGTVWIGRLASIGTPSYHFNGTIDEVVIYNRTLSASEILDLYQKRNATINWTLANVPAGTYKWNVQAFDSAGQSNWSSTNWTFTKISVPGANYSNFAGGATTDFDNEENIENVSGATLEKVGYGKIVWNGSVNASGADFDTNVNISSNFVRVNSSALHQSFNSSANITLYGISKANPYPFWDLDGDGTFEPCPTSACSVINYTGNNFTFSTMHFTDFIAGENVTSCGTLTTSGYYALTQNLSFTSSCITFGTNNILLDCQGNILNCTSGDSCTAWAISANSRTNITVKNCKIITPYIGVYFYSSSNSFAINNEIIGPYAGIQVGQTTYPSNNITVVNNTILGSRAFGIFGRNGYNSLIENNTIQNVPYGIYFDIYSPYTLNNNNRFIRNRIINSTYTDIATYNTVPTGNVYTDNIIGNSLTTSNISFIGDNVDIIATKDLIAHPKNITKYLNITNLTATGWIYLNISYNNITDVPDSVNESTLKWYRYNSTDWVLANTTSSNNGVDLVNKVVYVNITQFGSTFAPLGELPEPNFTISSCTTISSPGNYNLSQNLSSSATCITINSSDVELDCQGYSINGTDNSSSSGIIANTGLKNITVKGCAITNFGYGISFASSTNNSLIMNNTANSNRFGISLGGFGNVADNNTANFNVIRGIDLSSASNCNVTNNFVNYNSDQGLYLYSSSGNRLVSNNVNNNVNEGIMLIGGSNNNVIINNTAGPNNKYGVSLSGSSNNNLSNNTLNSNSYNGFNLISSSNGNTFFNNTANLNGVAGISMYLCSNNGFIANTLNNNSQGINLESGSGNDLINNTVNDNTYRDLILRQNSLNNAIINLTIKQNLVSFTSDNVSLKGVAQAQAPSDQFNYKNITKYLNITNLTASGWIYLNISYDNESDVPDGVDESTLKWYRYNSTDWVLANTSSADNGVDLVNKVVYANITSFGSTFAPLGFSGTEILTGLLVCVVNQTSCDVNYTEVLHMSNYTNAHAELANTTTDYNYAVCCKDALDVISIGTNDTGTLFLRLSNYTDAHVEKSSGANYSYPAYISASSGGVSCSYSTSCVGNQTCLATISGDTDAHIAGCGVENYSTKVCCELVPNVISSCPYNITKSDIYIINQSLTSEGDCILINATEAILDCGSNSITGNGSGVGVNVSGFDNATIRNCIITNFSTGILLADNSFGIIRDNRMTANYYGLQLLTSNDNEIETNNASGNEFADFYSGGGGLGNIITNLITQQNHVSFTSKDISFKGLTTAGVPLDLSGYKNISKYLNITNNSATGWIYLNVSYDETFDVPLDVAESTLKLYRYNNTDWVLANTTSADNGVDTTNNIVYANVTDFGSTFAPLGPISLPNATILGPGNGTITNDSYVNFTINLSAQAGLANATLNIYNETGGLYNQTTFTFTGSPLQYTLGIVVWLADGVYNWFWEIVDLVGNYVNTGVQEGGNRTIMADATAPTLNILFPLPIAYNYHNQTLNFSVYDDTSGLDTCWKRLNDGQNITISCYANSTVNSSTEGTVEGDNTIYLWANDSAGNVASDSVYYTLSTTIPAILLLTPENDSWLNHSDVNFSFNVLDESGIDTCELWGDWAGGWHNNQTFTSITNGSTSDVIKNISDGNYTWNVWCNDSIGNAGWHPDNHTFMVDATIPFVSIDYPGNITYNINVSELNYTASDTNLEACWYSIDNGTTNTTITCGNNVSGLTSIEGDNNWSVYANDSAGNENYSSVTFFKDTVYPLITIESPQNITYNNKTILVNLSVIELNIDNIWFFNGTENVTYTIPVNVTFSEGNNTLYAYVNDSAGNLNSTSVVFNTDTIPPNATLIYPPNETMTNGSYVNFTINLSDQNGLANATLNIYNETGGLYNQTTFTFTGSPIQYTLGIVVWLADGVYNWFWEVLDVMSNIVNTGVQEGGNRTITADTIAPAITIVSPINTTYNNRTQLVNISASDVNLNTTWFFNGTENVTYTTPDYVTFDEGGNTLYAYVNDSAGNLNSTFVVFSTDTIFPIYDNLTALPTSPTSYLPGQNYSFNATWTDNFGVESVIFEFNGTNYTTNNLGGGIYNFNISELVAGNYSYRWIANDSVGNTNQTSISYYLIDKALFNLTINIAPSNVVFRGTQTNVTGLGCPAQLSCLLYRNNINVSNPDIGKFEAGTYNYVYNTTGNENYTFSNKSASLTVNAPPVPPCVDVWTCGAWGSCVGSQQTRDCTSICGGTKTETQACCVETTVSCGGWSECANDEQIRECVSNCGTTTTESQACVLCVPEWSCTSFSSCVSGTITRTCTDSNYCGSEVGRPEETKECGVEPGKEGCSVDYSCGDWSECEYDSDASKILQGVIVEKGFKERECTDLNNCAGIYTERSSCTSEVQIETEQEDVCDKSTLTLFEKTSKSPVTSIDIESWNANKLDVAFTQQRAEYCPTCYNGVKDDDEENVDCGKSCRSCKSESKLPESTLPISASLIVLSLLILIPILKFFFEDYMIIRDVHALVKSGEAALKAGNREKAESDFRKMKWKYIQIEGNAKKKVILKEIHKYHSKIKKFTGF